MCRRTGNTSLLCLVYTIVGTGNIRSDGDHRYSCRFMNASQLVPVGLSDKLWILRTRIHLVDVRTLHVHARGFAVFLAILVLRTLSCNLLQYMLRLSQGSRQPSGYPLP